MYVAKFLALNLELDPPDYSNLGDNPEDVRIVNKISDRVYFRLKLKNSWDIRPQTLKCLTIWIGS